MELPPFRYKSVGFGHYGARWSRNAVLRRGTRVATRIAAMRQPHSLSKVCVVIINDLANLSQEQVQCLSNGHENGPPDDRLAGLFPSSGAGTRGGTRTPNLRIWRPAQNVRPRSVHSAPIW